MKRAGITVIAGILLILLCSGCSNSKCKEMVIPLSPETKSFLNTKPDMRKSLYDENGWNNYTAPSIASREKGYQEMPTADEETGQTIELENKVTERMYGQAHVYTLSPEEGFDSVIMYVHGGGYIFCGDSYHERMCDSLCSSLNAMVVLPFYGLAPQENYKAAYELLHAVYADILKLGKPIYIMGDSSGGGLAEGFVMDLKAKSISLPEKVVLISPWVDMTMTNPEIENYEEDDLMLTKYGTEQMAEMWSEGDDRKDYRLSPLYGDVKGMPETMITAGTREILYPDIRLMYEKYKDNKESCIIVVGEGMFHGFPMMKDDFKESKQCTEMIINFLK